MTFPVVAATNTTDISTDDTNHVINMPALISAGDLLLVNFVKDGADDATIPGDWTTLKKFQCNTADAWVYILRKTAAGSDTLTITSTAAERSAAVAFRITGWHGTTQPEAATEATGTDATAMNPPALTPSWGAEDTLWILCAGVNETATSTTIPTNYGNAITIAQTGIGEVQSGTCRRELNAISDDPDTWAWSAIRPFGVTTVAIRPAAVADLNTRSKRASSVNLLKPYIVDLVLPDASIDQGDRQHSVWAYSGILAAGAAGSADLSTRMIFIPDFSLGMSQITGG